MWCSLMHELSKSKQMPNATRCAGAIVWVHTDCTSKPARVPFRRSLSFFCEAAAVVNKATDANRHTQAKQSAFSVDRSCPATLRVPHLLGLAPSHYLTDPRALRRRRTKRREEEGAPPRKIGACRARRRRPEFTPIAELHSQTFGGWTICASEIEQTRLQPHTHDWVVGVFTEERAFPPCGSLPQSTPSSSTDRLI